MLCYRFPHKVAMLTVLRFPAQSGPFAPGGSDSSQRMSQRRVTQMGAIPTQPSTTRCM
jgi:hypothetical protein